MTATVGSVNANKMLLEGLVPFVSMTTGVSLRIALAAGHATVAQMGPSPLSVIRYCAFFQPNSIRPASSAFW